MWKEPALRGVANAMKRRFSVLFLLFALLAAACSSTGTAELETSTGSSDDDSSGDADASDEPEIQNSEPTVDGAQFGLNEEVASRTFMWQTDWSNATIDLDELALGIASLDPRDAIPPIDNPNFESPAEAAEWLAPNEPGALVQEEGVVRFFPLSIMTRHEIVNTDFGDTPVAVTYCPLCNTALAFDRRVDGETLRLGVSGLLRLSDMVMWDNVTDSLWQQITGEGIVGDFAGTRLDVVSTAIVSFEEFSTNFPDGESLSRDTGFGIEYGLNPYTGYSSGSGPIGAFFEKEVDPRFPALSRVVGVRVGDIDKAYSFEDISATGAINDDIEGQPVTVLWRDGTVDALDQGVIASSQAIGTAVAFDPTVNGQVLTFTASGDGFVDDQTGSTWTIVGLATDGELAGESLESIAHRNEFWFAWAGFFGETGLVYGE